MLNCWQFAELHGDEPSSPLPCSAMPGEFKPFAFSFSFHGVSDYLIMGLFTLPLWPRLFSFSWADFPKMDIIYIPCILVFYTFLPDCAEEIGWLLKKFIFSLMILPKFISAILSGKNFALIQLSNIASGEYKIQNVLRLVIKPIGKEKIRWLSLFTCKHMIWFYKMLNENRIKHINSMFTVNEGKGRFCLIHLMK